MTKPVKHRLVYAAEVLQFLMYELENQRLDRMYRELYSGLGRRKPPEAGRSVAGRTMREYNERYNIGIGGGALSPQGG